MLAFIGFIVLCVLAVKCLLGGVAAIFASTVLDTGRVLIPVGVFSLVIGVGLGYFACINAPFHIVFN